MLIIGACHTDLWPHRADCLALMSELVSPALTSNEVRFVRHHSAFDGRQDMS